jgi:hypothetical protein
MYRYKAIATATLSSSLASDKAIAIAAIVPSSVGTAECTTGVVWVCLAGLVALGAVNFCMLNPRNCMMNTNPHNTTNTIPNPSPVTTHVSDVIARSVIITMGC